MIGSRSRRETRRPVDLALLTLLVWSMADPAAMAQGGRYTFTKIADATAAAGMPGARCASINTGGTITFVAPDGAVWIGDGTSLTRLIAADSTTPPVTTVCPGLNDTNEVAYAVAQNAAATALLKDNGTTVTEIASSIASPYLEETTDTAIHSLTSAGTTLIRGADGVLYRMPGASPVYPATSALSSVLAGTMNGSGAVAFYATRLVGGLPRAGIYRGSGVPLIEEGTGPIAVIEREAPAINDSGAVVFRAQFADGTRHLLSTTNGTAFTDHSGAIGTVAADGFAINSGGTVAFAATSAGHAAIYTGPDPVNDRVIGPGDPLDGSVVVTVALWLDGINDAGQIAFRADLADGRSGVFRANRIAPPTAGDGALAVTFNTLTAGQLTGADAAGLPLTYAVVATPTKGTVTITDPSTGAYVYAPAPNALGNDSFTFKTNNGYFDSTTATVSVTISPGAPGNTAPVAVFEPNGSLGSVRYNDVGDELFRTTNLPPITSFTMMGWFRFLGDTNNFSAFLRLGHAQSSDGYNLLRCCGRGSNRLGLWTNAQLLFGPALTSGTWYHFAVVVEGAGPGQVKVYSNGALVLTLDGNPAITSQRLSIGNDSHDEWLDGSAANVKIYDAALTGAEIAREMNAFAPERTQNLNAWYPLLSAESAAADASGNARTLTLTGPIETDPSVPPVAAAVTFEDTAINGTLRATDAEGNPVTFALVGSSTTGSVAVDPATGAYTYTPGAGASGYDAFTFKANDGQLDSAVANAPLFVLPRTFATSVTVAGGGVGTIKISPPEVVCTDSCVLSFQRGTSVTFVATANASSAFMGWTGSCSGTGPCTVSVDGALDVTGTFEVATRDLLVTNLGTPPAAIAPGSSFALAVTTSNQGTSPTVSTTTRFYLSADGVKGPGDVLFAASLAVSSLSGGASVTGTVTLAIPANQPLGSYVVIACADDGAVVAETSETNNCRASTPINVQRADLVETALSNPPAALAPGGTFNATDTVHNRGLVTAGASTTRYYLSTDATFSADDLALPVGRSVTSLAPDATSTGTRTLTVPTTMPLGTYVLIACADHLFKVAESDETNNCVSAATPLRVGRPDLIESSVSNPPAGLAPGATFSITDTVANTGDTPSGSSTTRYYLSTNGAKAGATLLSVTRSVGSVAAGGTSTAPKTVMVPADLPLGAYRVVTCADDLSVVVETDETNNCLASQGSVLVGWADLVISSVTNPPVEIALGKTFSITAVAANQGAIAASTTSTTRFYLSVDAVRSADDVLLSGTISVGTLATGATASGSVTALVPAATPTGQYRLLACADDTVRVAEGPDEANNCTAAGTAVDVRAPDLFESAITNPPATLSAGASFTLTETVVNGGTIAAGASTTRFYLSLNGARQGAVLLVGLRSVGPLAVGESSAGTRTVTVPTSIAAGTYFLLACADDTSGTVELNEANNCLAAVQTTTVK